MLTLAVSLLVGALAVPAAGGTIELPTPQAARVQQASLITAVGGRPDRFLMSDVPGPVNNAEIVRVGLGGDGSVRTVTADQRLELTVARAPSAARLLSTDDLLPHTLEVTRPATVAGAQAVPLRVTGLLRLSSTTGAVSGPATAATPDGARFAGTLGGVGGRSDVSFTVQAAGPGVLALDLTAVNALNPQALTPPDGFASWTAWAMAGPAIAERKAALDLLVQVAAAGARASSYSPYLGADLVGKGSTTFTYSFAPAGHAAAVARVLYPRWGAICLAGLALLLVLGNAALIWRRS